jgi:RecB family endonuclease NucS
VDLQPLLLVQPFPARGERADRPAPAPQPVAWDGASLRSWIAGHPEHVEAGLTVWSDEKGTAGVGYPSEVGEIDLLARDDRGELVVLMVAEGAGGDPVSAVLERIGWVEKHLARRGERVRGIVVLGQTPRPLGYAARAVAGTVSFKTFRIAFQFDDLKL